VQHIEDLSLILDEAKQYFKNKDYSNTVNLLNKIIEMNPKNYLAYFYKGNVAFQLSDYSNAIKYYDRALKINPYYFRALTKKGLAIYQFSNYFEKEKFNEAISCLDKAISLAPTDPESWYYKGLLIRDHYLLGKYDDDMSHYTAYFEVRECFEKALQNDPEFPVDDEKVFELELAVSDNFKKMFYERGLAYQRSGDNETAVKYFNLVLRFDSNFKEAYDEKVKSISKLRDSKTYSKFKFW